MNRKGKWITTFTGERFYPLDPRPIEVSIEDIAHSLSMLCRFTGHCHYFYSVAQHSIAVASLLPREHKLEGLFHDAAEAYMGDIARPWKDFLYVHVRAMEANTDYYEKLRVQEDKLLAVIYDALGIVSTPESKAAVKRADDLMLAHEIRNILTYDEKDPYWQEWLGGQAPLPGKIHCLSPDITKALFKHQYSLLKL